MRVIGIIFFVLVVVGGGVAIVYGLTYAAPVVIQPIAFNHVVHVEEARMQCVDCHLNATTGVYAGIPGKNICLDCHDIDDEEGSHPEKDELFSYVDTDQDIPWLRVAVTRPDVYFSHRRHVSSAQMDCLECHADQPTLIKPPSTSRLVMSMNACIDCHEERGASTDCLACHR